MSVNGSGEPLDPFDRIAAEVRGVRRTVQSFATPVLRTDAATERTEKKVDAIVRHDLGQSYPLLAMLGAMLLVGVGALVVLILILLRLSH